MKIRWGVLSTARITDNLLEGARFEPHVEFVAVASRDRARAERWAAEHKIRRAFGSYEELIASNEIDAVYNPLPNSLHREWTVRAAQHGKHVLCEKPLTIRAAEADEVIAASLKNGVKVMEAFMYRFHPQMGRARELVSSGALGQIRMARATFSFLNSRPEDIRWDPGLGGGALLDIGCYCVNGVNYLLQSYPVAVSAAATYSDRGVDETLAGVLEYPHGVYAVIDCSFGLEFNQELEVQGTQGKLTVLEPWRMGREPVTLVRTRAGKRGRDVERITIPGADEYGEMLEHFSLCLLENRAPAYPLADSRANMAVLDALAQSAREKRRVVLSSG